MQVAVYTEGDETVGLVGIKGTDGKHVSITFDKQQMLTFIALVQKARAIQSDGWVEAGSFSETETSSPSHIVVYGGPSLQFSLTDPSIGSYNWSTTTVSNMKSLRSTGKLVAPRAATMKSRWP